MSGSITYDAGSNFVTPGRSNPQQMSDPTFSAITPVMYMLGGTTKPFVNGLFTLNFTTATQFKITDPNGTTVTVSGVSYPYLFARSTIGVTFTITQNAHLIAAGDVFYMLVSSQAQKTTTSTAEATGIRVNVQDFLADPSTAQQDWTTAINAMFTYCGQNPSVVGIIPPGVYECDGTGQLLVQSGMTISAYGAIICTGITQTGMGDNGFLTNPGGSERYPAVISGVTIMGGTWGGTGVNGALQTNNEAVYDASRTGRVISLFVTDLTLIDVTVRGYSNGNAFSLTGDNMLLQNCSFWNSDGQMGSGGIRINCGNNIRVSNTQGKSGDDCLQFAPGPGTNANFSVTNAFYIGGNVESVTARAMVATLTDIAGGGTITAAINNVGWIGIVGVSDGGSSGTATADVILIANTDSSKPISNVTVMGCKLTGNGTQSTTSPCRIIGTRYTTVPPAIFYSGGINGVNFIDVSLTGPESVPVVYLDGYSDNTLMTGTVATPYVSTSNINFLDCALTQMPAAGTAMAPVQVNSCQGYSFRNCTMTAPSTTTNAMVLGGLRAVSANFLASYGVIENCSFFTTDATSTGQSPPILVQNGDMNAIQGWCKFFVGTVPSLPSGGVAGSTTAGVQILANGMNTFVDNVDLRGLNTSSPVLDAGTGTRIGLNVNVQSTGWNGALILTKANNGSSPGTITWPANTIVLELTLSAGVSGYTINLPTSPADGEVHILATPLGTYSNVTFSPMVRGFTNGSSVDPTTPVRMMWGTTGHWFRI